MRPPLPVALYRRDPYEDLAIAAAWNQMRYDSDITNMFGPRYQGLSGLLQLFQPPGAMIYAWDASRQVMWGIAWYEELMNGLAMGLWIERRHRNTRAGLDFCLRAAELGLTQKSTLFIVTKQERMLDELSRVGYTLLSRCPRLWDDEHDGWLLMLTRAALDPVLDRYRGVAQPVEATEEVR